MTQDPDVTVCENDPTHPPLTYLGEATESTPAASSVVAIPSATSRATDDPPVEVPDSGEISAVLESLRELAAQKDAPLLIGLMGFSTTGKTWLLERLKAEYCDDFEVEPPPGYSRTLKVTATRHSSLHRFSCPGHAERSFYVVDVPGEYYAQAMDTGFTGGSAELLEIASLCNAYLFVLPSAEYLFMEELYDRGELIDGLPTEQGLRDRNIVLTPANRQELNDTRRTFLQMMQTTLGRLALAMAFIEEKGGVKAALDTGMSAKALLDFGERKKRRKSPKPAALLLTMADRMQPVIDASLTADPRMRSHGGIQFDADPVPLLMRYRPGLLKSLARSFRWWKVDFATASDAHEGGFDFDKRRDHYGVLGVIDWFRRARRASETPSWLRPADSGLAIRARRLLNPRFGAAWRSAASERR